MSGHTASHSYAPPETRRRGVGFLHLWRGKLLTRRHLPMARVRMPADGSTVLHMCRRPHRCCFTCGYHAPTCRHTRLGRVLLTT